MSNQPPQQPPHNPPASGAPLNPSDEQTWASLAHFGGVLGFLPSLIIWLVFKDRSQRVNVEAKEALNFQITMTIIIVAASIVFSILTFILWVLGFLTPIVMFALWAVLVVFSILGGLAANKGQSYRYPFNFRLIK